MRWLRWVAAAIGVLLVAAVALVLVVAFRPSIITRQIQQRVLPEMSKQLGREISVGRIEPKLLPLPQARIENFQLAGFKGDAPLVRADAVSFRLQLWPLIRSLGQDVRLNAVELSGPEINLVRARNGTWNYEGIGQGSQEPSTRTVTVSTVHVHQGTVRVIDRSAAGNPMAVALRAIDATASDIGTDRPVSFDLRAAFASAAQNLHLKGTATPAGNAPTVVDGKFDLNRADIERLRSLLPEGAAATITGGAVSLEGTIATRDGRYVIDGNAHTDELALRGNPARASFHASSRIDPNKPQAARIALDRIVVQGPGVNLNGDATVQAQPMRARFNLRGPLLDLNTLMATLPESEAAPRQPGEPLLPESVRNQLAAADVKGSLQVDKLVAGALNASNLRAQAGLERGELVLSQAAADFYGGTLDASGTRIDLSRASPSWRLKAQLANLDLGQAMQQVAGIQPLRGLLAGQLDLSGIGLAWNQLRSNLTGSGAMQMRDGMLASTDLAQQFAGPLNDALRMTGQLAGVGGTGGDPTAAIKGTPLRDLASSIQIRDGWIQFANPVSFASDFGKATLGGRVGLDLRLALRGNATLSPDYVARATNGFNPGVPLTIPLGMDGSLQAPAVRVSSQEIAQSFASGLEQAGRQKANQLENQAKKNAEEEIRKRAGEQFNKVLGQ